MATIQDLGKVAYFNKGMYNSETNYEINDVVSYNGSSYVSLLNNNQGNLPTNATYWSVVALKGDKGDTGKPFVIEKTYESIEDMVADYDNMQVNDYVMIQGNIEEEENATLWTKTETEVSPYKWVYLADFSGASGITGATPNIQIGTVTEGNEPAVTRRAGSTNENPILDFVLKTGATGENGATGNGISSVSKTSTSGLTDTYTITYTNGNTTTFDVTNGKGIDRIEKTATVGNKDTYTIYFNDNSTSTFEVANGEVTREELEEEVDRLSMIYNLFPTTSDEDTEMTLDGTGEVKLKKIGLKGNTSQYTTTGKNLNYLQNLKWITNSSGEVVTNNYYWNAIIDTTNNNSIYISGNYSLLSDDVLRIGLYSSYPQLGSQGTRVTYAGNSALDTTNCNYVLLCYSTSSGHTIEEVQNSFMVSYGTTMQPYEPYTGNQPAPNPDYPQDIEVVTGDNSIEVVGKNLCNGITQNYFANQETTRCGYAVGDSGLIIEVDGASDYTISSNTVQTRYRVGCLNEIPVEGGSNTIVYNGSNKDGTNDSVTINTNGYKYLVVNATDLTAIQIEKGSTATTYTPYVSQSYPISLGNIELCRIVNYQDYIYKYSGKWYLNKQIGKVVLDGSEDWAKSSRTTVHRYSVANIIQTVFNPDVVDLMSNYFTCITQNQSDSDNIGLSKLNANGFMNNFDLSNTGFDTLEKYKTWLSTHNTIVYYILETPTITEITDTTLIEQLDNLENAYSYDTQTNITQTNDDMPFILDVEALMSLKNIFNS